MKKSLLSLLFILYGTSSESALVIAHRGVHHTYGRRLDNGCREYVNQRHRYIENTIPSIAKAFEYGADKVEIDLMVTKDEKVFLFHDEDLRCHLGFNKLAPDSNWDEIKNLDPGYGVTFDGGKTYPLRNSGYKIPLLEEVLEKFPGKSFLLNPKLYSSVLTKNLIQILKKLPESQRRHFWFWGDDKTFREVNQEFPEIQHFLEIPRQHQDCMNAYFASGWYGEFPEICKNREISLGDDRWWMLWDFPFPFLLKAAENNLKVSLWLGNRVRKTAVYDQWPLEAVTISNIDLQE